MFEVRFLWCSKDLPKSLNDISIDWTSSIEEFGLVTSHPKDSNSWSFCLYLCCCDGSLYLFGPPPPNNQSLLWIKVTVIEAQALVVKPNSSAFCKIIPCGDLSQTPEEGTNNTTLRSKVVSTDIPPRWQETFELYATALSKTEEGGVEVLLLLLLCVCVREREREWFRLFKGLSKGEGERGREGE